MIIIKSEAISDTYQALRAKDIECIKINNTIEVEEDACHLECIKIVNIILDATHQVVVDIKFTDWQTCIIVCKN